MVHKSMSINQMRDFAQMETRRGGCMHSGDLRRFAEGVLSIIGRPADPSSSDAILLAHRRFHDKAGCPGPPECYVCVAEGMQP